MESCLSRIRHPTNWKIFWVFLLLWELLRWMYVDHSHCVLSLAAVVRKGLISKTNGVSLRSASQPNFQGDRFRIMTRSRTGLSQSSPGVWVSVAFLGDAFFSWSELANRVSSFSRCHLWTGPGPSCIGPGCISFHVGGRWPSCFFFIFILFIFQTCTTGNSSQPSPSIMINMESSKSPLREEERGPEYCRSRLGMWMHIHIHRFTILLSPHQSYM